MKIILLIVFSFLLLNFVFGSVFDVDPVSQNFRIKNTNFTTFFHGVNVVYKPPPYHPTINGSFDTQVSLVDKDFELMNQWGFNIIRLYIAWEGTEPQKGQYSQSYLNTILNIVRTAAKYNIAVILDMHQDLGSDFFCGEGFPDWAVNETSVTKSFPFPYFFNIRFDEKGHANVEDCLKHPFFEYYLTTSVSELFQAFYDNKNNILDQFGKFWQVVAKTFQNEPNVLGYELINEPFAGNFWTKPQRLIISGYADEENIMPAYKKLHEYIRAVDDDTIILYEPMVSDIWSVGFKEGPGGKAYDNRQAFSYHVYCFDVDKSGDPKSKFICKTFDDAIFNWRTETSKSIGGGRILTEFGAISNSSKGVTELEWITGEAEKRFTSWVTWQYKYYNDYTTAADPADIESFWNRDGELRVSKVKALSRTFAQQLCGIPTFNEFNPNTSQYQLKFILNGHCNDQTSNPYTIIYYNKEYYYSNGIEVNVQPAEAKQYIEIGNPWIKFQFNDKFVGSEITITVIVKN